MTKSVVTFKGIRVISAATARPQDNRRDVPRHVALANTDGPKRLYPRRPIILYGGKLTDAARNIVGHTCDFFRIKRVADNHLQVRDESGNDYRLTEPPIHLLAIFGFDKADFDIVVRASEWLKKRRPKSVFEPHLLAGDNTEVIATQLLSGAFQELTIQSEMSTAFARQLSDARKANEDLQNRFAALENVINRHGLQPFESVFCNEPAHGDNSTDYQAPNVLAMSTNGRLSQILPVASLGVSAVALHVARTSQRSDATIEMALETIEDGITIETWAIPASELVEGWTTLSLRRAITGLRRTLRLVISVDGTHADLPVFSLGGAQPLEMFRLQDHELHQSITASSLALQIFVGLPGVVPPAPNEFTPQSTQGSGGTGLREHSLTPEILRLAVPFQIDSETGGFDGVSFLEETRIISCHPPAYGMTVARLPAACPAHALRLSANLFIDHPQSKDVEFALVASNDSSRISDLLLAQTEPQHDEGFSGWVRVPAKKPRFASMYVDGSVATTRDLYLVTRMVEAGNHDFAWARFLNLHALVQG